MPIYEYKCPGCGHMEEHLVSSQNPAPACCSCCGAPGLERVFSSSFGVVIPGEKTRAGQETCCGSSTPCAHPKHCCGK